MVKRIYSLFLVFLFLTALAGCARPAQTTQPVQAEGKVTGTVTAVYDDSVDLYCQTIDGYSGPQRCQVYLGNAAPESYVPCLGDLVSVYFDGEIAEVSPLVIDNALAVALVTPAETDWTDEAIGELFENGTKSRDTTLFGAAAFPDRAQGQIGAVLYRNNANNTCYAAFLNEQGHAQLAGFPDLTGTDAGLTYLGDAAIGFRLNAPGGETLDYRVAIAIEGNGTNFTVSTETVQK